MMDRVNVMEIDIEEIVVVAATISVDWNDNLLDKTCLVMAFEELYPEAKLVKRFHKQLRNYKKLVG
jgi:hypothetical protein